MTVGALLLQFFKCASLSVGSSSFSPTSKMKVVVTGAAGRTGNIVFSSLHANPSFDVIGLVRTEKSAKKLMKQTKCGLDQVLISDITEISTTQNKTHGGIFKACEGADAMIVCTSATPSVSKLSMVRSILKIPFNVIRGKKFINFRDLTFVYKPGQYPRKVDFEGQIRQIDFAKSVGIGHIVLVSSMGGTDKNNFLNSVGKKKNGKGEGDILVWKRKAEKYLVGSGLDYTIIHPGELIDSPGSVEELVLDVDDKLLLRQKKSISRSDVANLCIAAIAIGKKKNISFDCVTEPVEGGTTPRSAEDVLEEFIATGKTADYDL